MPAVPLRVLQGLAPDELTVMSVLRVIYAGALFAALLAAAYALRWVCDYAIYRRELRRIRSGRP